METLNKTLQIIKISFLLLFVPLKCFSQTSTINGDWDNNATWGGVTYPDYNMGSGDVVTIAAGDTVTLNQELDVRSGSTLNIYGYLIVTHANGITFYNGCNATIHTGGTLECETGVTNNNASGITVDGTLLCLGDYTAGTGSVMAGDGAIQVQGTLTVSGSADVMGVTNPGCNACNVTEAAGITNAALYEEDFSNDAGNGYSNNVLTDPTDANWTLTLVGTPDVYGSNDHCQVQSGTLEWKDNACYSGEYVEFYSAEISGAYNDVSIDLDYYVNDASCYYGENANLTFYYKVDGGSWVEYATHTSTGTATSGSETVTGLSFSSTFQIKIRGNTPDCSGAYNYVDNIAVYGVQSTDPNISCSASLTTFSSCYGSNSSEQSFTVTGSYLTDDFLTVTAPTGFEVSKTSGSGFSSSVDLAVSSGSVGSTTIYVRTNTSSVNGDGGNIACSSPDDGVTTNIATGSASITSSVYYVATTGSDSNSGLTSGSPFATIQHAIDQINVSCGSAVIYVADGTYDESNIDIDLSVTIIGDSESGTIIDNDDVNGEYCFLVTTDNADVKLQNLTIRDFKDDAGCAFKSYQHDNKIVFDAVTINSCYVNSGSTYDGVVFIYHDTGATSNDSIVIKNSTFSDNTSAEASGGCALDIGSYSYDYDYSILLENTTFDNNDVTTPGSSYAACMIDRGYSVTVKKCTFSNNNNYYYGSGLYVSYLGSSSGIASRFTVENCLFHDNSASNGGSCTVYNVRGSVFNSTFAQNSSSNVNDYYVTGLDVDGVVTAKNCIFQSDDSGNEVIQGYSGDLTISYSLLYGGSGGDSYTDGGNNLSSDPDFTNAGSNDFTLASTSPCIDAGTATGAPSDDIAGTTRDATPDLGCYEAMSNEWTGAVSTAWTNTGNWSLGTVPTSSDVVTIPDVTNQPVITSTVTLAGLTIASGSDITLSSNSLTVTGTFDLNGTMNIDNSTVNADGTFDATGGTIDFTNTNGKLILSSTVTSLGTLDAAMGTVEYDGSTQDVLADAYNNLEIDQSGTKTSQGTITVASDLTVQSGSTFAIDATTITVTGTSDVNGTTTLSTGTFNADGASDIDGNLSITSTGVYDADGSFDATSGNVTFTGNGRLQCSSTVTSLGTLSSDNGTVEYDGATQTVFGDNYYNLEIDVSGTKTAGGAINVDGNLSTSATSGCKLDMGVYALNLAGNLTVGATDGLDLSDGSSLATFDGSSDQTLTHAGNSSGGGTGQTIFFEDFTSPDAGWTDGAISGSNSWAIGVLQGAQEDPSTDYTTSNTDNKVAGQGMSASSGDGLSDYYDNSNEWLKSPVIDCSNFSNVELSFARHAYFESCCDESYVEISLNNSTWSDLSETLRPTDGSWTLRTIDISSYADGQSTVYIRWRSDSDGSVAKGGWNIDDVLISGDSPITSGSEFNDLTINNSGGNIILDDEISVDGTITFTSGDIDASSNNLVLESGADVSGADDDSHVVGTIVKTIASDASHEFPLGNGTVLRKVDIDPNDATSRDWTVTYNDNVYSDVTTTGLLTYVSDTCYWDITPTSTPASTTVKLNWTSAIGINDADLSNIKLAHYNGTDWELISTTTTGVPLAGSVSGNVTSFSPFTIGTTGANPLPVTLTQFEGYAYSDLDNKLEWTTKTEKNADYMEIQHSDDGKYFNSIGISKLAGNSQTDLFYEFIDRSVAKQINYYRLKQFDYDGKFNYSKIISIDNRHTEAKVVKYMTNLIGQKVDKNYKGVVIIYYTDGSSIKTIQ